jgi:hypothetical protein
MALRDEVIQMLNTFAIVKRSHVTNNVYYLIACHSIESSIIKIMRYEYREL